MRIDLIYWSLWKRVKEHNEVGMNVAMFTVDEKHKPITYVAAKSPLYLIPNKIDTVNSVKIKSYTQK